MYESSFPLDVPFFRAEKTNSAVSKFYDEICFTNYAAENTILLRCGNKFYVLDLEILFFV